MPRSAYIGRSPVGIDPSLPRHETVIHALSDAANIAPDRIALVCGESRLSYAQYLRAVAGIARHLAPLRVAGGRVAVLMSNSIEMAAAQLGVMAARAQMAPLNPFFTVHELRPLLEDAEAAAIVCDAAAEEKARALAALARVPQVVVIGPGRLPLDAWVDDPAIALPQRLPARTDWAILPYTGGTTGVSKGAMHQHGNITSFFPQVYGLWPLGFDDQVFLNVAPMFHIWGFQFATWIPIYARSTLVIVPKYDPAVVLEQLARHRVTVFAGGPPAIYMGLMAAPNFGQVDLSRLRYCLCGGAPAPEQLLRGWEAATGCALLEGWGMSEGAPINSNPIHGVRKLLSTGLTSPATEIDIVDVETGTRVLDVGEAGEIRVRGPQFTQGYRNRPEENARALRDGWLYTGDVGYFDEDGYLFIVDRKKDMALVGGYNVFPREVDEVLFRHPEVREAAAFGVPHPRLGETIVACVVPRPGTSVTVAQLEAWCAEHLVKYKRPTDFRILEALPRTGANKIDKRALKAAHFP